MPSPLVARAAVLRGGGHFYPLQIAPAAWWAADDLADGSVTTWTDRVGSLAPTQATGSLQPVKASTSFNDHFGGVTFDGADDYLSIDAVTGLPTGATPGSIWIVGTPASSNGIIAANYGGTSVGSHRRLSKTATTNVPQCLDGTTTAVDTAGPTWLVPAIIEGVFDATAYTIRRNGLTLATATGATLNTGTTRARIGANTAGTAAAFFQGVIRHVLITPALTQAQRLRLEAWLAWDSGLQSSLISTHPFRTVRP